MQKVVKSIQNKALTDKEISETVVAVLSHNTRKEQAKALGISRQGLYKRLVNHPNIKQIALELSNKANNLMALASLKASYKLISLIDSDNQKLSLLASCEVLDRVGITKENAPIPNKDDNEIKIKLINYEDLKKHSKIS